jgi:hypothetical protein
MQFEIQAHALLPQVLFSMGYLLILFFARRNRDKLGLLLITAFCILLGLRDISAMAITADPISYAFVLSYPGDISTLAHGADYFIFVLLHSITGRLFSLAGCFFALHLVFIPALYLLYLAMKRFNGVFFLLVGWFIFVNSGLLLLANFFRQGLSVIVLLALLATLCVNPSRRKALSTLLLPLLHAGSLFFIPGLLAWKKKHSFLISALVFLAVCIALHFLPSLSSAGADYFNAAENNAISQFQLVIKIASIYAMLVVAILLLRATEISEDAHMLQRATLALLLPTAALLLTYNAPVIGLRCLYYSYALAFLYLFSAVNSRHSESLFKLSAIAICLFGIVTWTYPTVAVLMVW